MNDELILRIYRETIDALYEYVSRRCGGDRQLAEDITQDTWLRALPVWRRKGVPDRPIAWLTTVAHNLLLNEFRRRKPELLDHVSAEQVMGAVEEGEAEHSAQTAALLNHALARLPRAQALLIEAFHLERCRMAQLAESFGISERAVEGRLRRARENLRRELEAVIQANGGLR